MRIEQYGHGGDVWTAEKLLGVPKEQLLDLSANINPLGPPKSVWKAIEDGLPSIMAYPDSKARELKSAIADKLGVTADDLVVGNGAAEVLYGLMRALSPRSVGLVQPCFSEYEEASRVVNSEIVSVLAREEDDFLPALDELLEACDRVDLFVVGHPNNPNGRLLPVEWLAEMSGRLAHRGAWLLVDEAFVDFLPDAESLLGRIDELGNVILLRSMTKFYSIPGLRLGYAVAVPDVARRIEREMPPWSVNSLAQLAGIAGLADTEFEEATWEWLQAVRPRFVEQLSALPGVKVFHGEVNFVLFYCEVPDLQSKLGRAGILIRSCAMYPGLRDGFYRVAVREQGENALLLARMSQIIGGETVCHTR